MGVVTCPECDELGNPFHGLLGLRRMVRPSATITESRATAANPQLWNRLRHPALASPLLTYSLP